MVRRPDTPDALVDTGNRLGGALGLLAAGLLEQSGFLGDLVGLQVAHADRLFFPVDVVASDDGVLAWSRRDVDFDLRVGLGEGAEVV